ncbi:MAG: biotin transporter BioY [Chlamydiales bacterium]
MLFVDLMQFQKKEIFKYGEDIFYLFFGSFFLALMSQCSFYLWFTPIPISMQSFGVLLIGYLFGSKRGSLVIMTYLTEGAFGLPVFAGGGSGIATLMGLKGGYYLGFILSAFLVGYLIEKKSQESYRKLFIVFLLGTFVILTFGATWLGCFIGMGQAFPLGVAPFLIGDFLKASVALLVVRGMKRLPE